MADRELAELAAMIRSLDPCERLDLAIRLLLEARKNEPEKARLQLVLAGAVARTVADEIEMLFGTPEHA